MSAILITGATGKQGGAVINELLRRDLPYQLLAVTRNTQSASAQRLASKSTKIQLVEGNLDSPTQLFQNARAVTKSPIWGVYSVQTAIGKDINEEQQGKGLIDEALNQGVKHFVYSSVDRGGEESITNPTNIPHFMTKHHIEMHLLARTRDHDHAMDWTILRPTAFMGNLTPDFMGKVFATSWKAILKDKPLQLVATSDIGFFAAESFAYPERYRGRAISLAGDELTFQRMAEIFRAKVGREVPTTFELPVRALMAMVGEFGTMFRWFREEGYGADVQALRVLHPEMKDFGTWLETQSGFRK